MTTVAPARRDAAERWLALPLVAFALACFVAPLAVLVAVSLHADNELRVWSLAQYARLLGETFTLGILVDTLWLGVKSTLVCLVFAYPLAWIAVRASPRMRSLLLFL